MKKFAEETRQHIITNNIGDNYCIIVYKSTMDSKRVAYIYKTIDDFEAKVENDIKTIDTIFGIDFQLWIFD